MSNAVKNNKTSNSKKTNSQNPDINTEISPTIEPHVLISSAIDNLHTMPEGIKKSFDVLTLSENKIQELTDQIKHIKEKLKLKPLTRGEKDDGVKKEYLSKSQKNILRIALKRLEKRLFQEKDNWAGLIIKFGTNVSEDGSKVKDEFALIKARSPRYINRNKALVDRKIKKIFNYAKSNTNELSTFRDSLSLEDSIVVETAVKQFLEKYDEAKFISAAYNSLDSFRPDFNDSMKNILNEWQPSDQEFEFMSAKAKFNIKSKGIKR